MSVKELTIGRLEVRERNEDQNWEGAIDRKFWMMKMYWEDMNQNNLGERLSKRRRVFLYGRYCASWHSVVLSVECTSNNSTCDQILDGNYLTITPILWLFCRWMRQRTISLQCSDFSVADTIGAVLLHSTVVLSIMIFKI